MRIVGNWQLRNINHFQDRIDLVNTIYDRSSRVEGTLSYQSKKSCLFGNFLNPTKVVKPIPMQARGRKREDRFCNRHITNGIPLKYVTTSTMLICCYPDE